MAELQDLVCRCLAERREAAIQRLVSTLEDIASDGPEKEPKPSVGSDTDTLLAWEDGFVEAAFEAASKARRALETWEADNG